MIKDEKEQEVEKQQFEKKYPNEPCASWLMANCQEYKFKTMITRSFPGKFATYLTGGFHIDFANDISDNSKKLK